MSTTFADTNNPGDQSPSTDELIEHQLDQLMPKPLSAVKRWILGASLVVLALLVGIGWTMGYIVPNPFAGGGWSSGSAILVSEDRSEARVGILIPNFSNRAVTLTGLELDAPGLELINATARLDVEPDDSQCQDQGDGSTVCMVPVASATPFAHLFLPRDPLPVSIPAGRTAEVLLVFELEDCEAEVSSDWGGINADFSFGDAAFPPFSATHTLDDRLLKAGATRSLRFVNGPDGAVDSESTNVTSAQELLSTLCEVLNSPN